MHPIPMMRSIERREHYEGPIPPPHVLQQFDNIVPGTAANLIRLAEEESLHRRKMESMTVEANVRTQEKGLIVAEYKVKGVFRSDVLGQVAGILVSLSCVGGAVYLGIHDHEAIATALTVIPSAAVIQAFFAKKQPAQRPDDRAPSSKK